MSNILGDQLHIMLKNPINQRQTINLTIFYSTTNQANALSWMTPEQTASKVLPYLYSQCEPAYCRSIAPLQDTPAIKSTYSSVVTVKDPIVVFLSANLTGKNPSSTIPNHTEYHFEMAQPIPSYLLAIVAGNVVEKSVG
jgi:leukotriene-A4 hydrolase